MNTFLSSSTKNQFQLKSNLFQMKRILLFSISLMFSVLAIAQPTAMSINQDVNGTYTNYSTTLKGGFFQAQFQESTGQASGVRNWQFNSDSYNNVWGTVSSTKTLAAYNTAIVPSTTTASGNWVAAGYNNFGRLPATQSGFYYTYNILKGSSYASQNMAVLETSYLPKAISSVTQSPAVPTGCQTAVVTINMASAPSVGENVYVRYTTNAYATSALALATFSGNDCVTNGKVDGCIILVCRSIDFNI